MMETCCKYYCGDNIETNVERNQDGTITLVFDSHPNKVRVQLPANSASRLSGELASKLAKAEDRERG